MKKFISLLCALTVLIGMMAVAVVSASAAEPAQTMVDVKKGDKVSYVLQLADVPEGIVCYDVMFRFDSDVLKLDSLADFSNSTDEDDWGGNGAGIINTETGVDGQILANWYTGSTRGLDFSSKRNFFTLNFTAKASGTAHISYHVTDMAGNSYFENPDKPVISQYTFTCSVTVNGKSVLNNAQPELAEVQSNEIGSFTNSVTGKSADAGEVVNGQPATTRPTGSTGSGSSDSTKPASTDPVSTEPTTSSSEPATQAASDNAKGGESTPDDVKTIGALEDETEGSDDAKGSGSSAWLWIVIVALVVIAGGGVAAYLINTKKKSNASTDHSEGR